MKKTATVLFVILGLSIIAAMIGISTSANERANENLSFTVKTDRIVYDMTQQVITIPVKPNKSVNASDVHAVLTFPPSCPLSAQQYADSGLAQLAGRNRTG